MSKVYSVRGADRGFIIHDHTYATLDEAERAKQALHAKHPQWKIGIKSISSEQPLIVFRNGRWVSRKSEARENPVSIQWRTYIANKAEYYAEGVDGAEHAYQIKGDSNGWYTLRCNKGTGWRTVGSYPFIGGAKDAARDLSYKTNPLSITQWGLIYAGVVGVGVVAYELLKKPTT